MAKPVNAVWQKFKEARVIGDVVNNFVPRIYVHVIYRHKRFSLGNELPFSVAQSQPDNIEIETEDFDVDMQQQVSNSKFVIVSRLNSYFVILLGNRILYLAMEKWKSIYYLHFF